ncbi:MAG TPA: response regulator transcription factor [Blastocatellia bacterium]|nr:response regulator transcription factor [Blastocatellia bacterium]
MKLLIAEDNDGMRGLIKRLVADFASEIYECRDGSEALAVCLARQPDWVLMDIRLDGLNGLTATRRITAAWPQAKIMIITDYDDDELREAARHAGACEYVVKENLLELRRLLVRLNQPSESTGEASAD